MPRDPPGSAGGSVWEEGSLGAPATRPPIGGRERRQSKCASKMREFRLAIFILQAELILPHLRLLY